MKNAADGGEAIVEAFRKLGVEYILSSPGTEWTSVWEAMADQIQQGKNGPKLMDCWHETLAVDIATGYTLVTGRMQGVLLHAGAGLLQGLMGVHGALLAGVPMVVISGESLTYGEEPGLDPGRQWVDNLSIVGGPQRLVEPLVKFASQAGSTHTLFESIIRAGEMAQRVPLGPTYLSVPTETMLDEWTPLANGRTVPAAPINLSTPADIEKLAGLLAKAKMPVVVAEAAGSDAECFEALVALSESAALPVVEKPGALLANFPKDHPMHQGHDFQPYWEDSDLVIVIRTRTPWYPPSRRPPNAVVAVIDEAPHRLNMGYQSLQADMYLEGDVASTLRALTDAVAAAGPDKAETDARRERLATAHDQLHEKLRGIEDEARKKTPIDPIWLCAALGKVMPPGTSYIDEVTTHTPLLRQHIPWNEPHSLFTRQGGLGQGLGMSLGVKLARPESPVVTLIGDGAFLYNPVLQSLGASRDFNLPILVVIFDNKKYAAMQNMHLKMYPDGTAVSTDTFHGTHINGPDYVKVVEAFGGYGERVEDPERLEEALRGGLDTVNGGRTAIIDVALA
ncbi:MAG: thiamine pyrophosphate-dependent enzyme [Alphaproteobacteria bacterium]